MKVQLLLLAAFACLATSQEQQQPGEDLDSLIEGVFGKPKDQERGPPKDPNQIDINNGPPIGGGTIDIANGENVRPEDCQCVPYYQCSNGTINSDGVGLIDIRFKDECDHYLAVCCKNSQVISQDQIVTPKPIERKGCGERRPGGVGFRIQGDENNEAQFGEFPWMVAILKEESVDQHQKINVYQCGGSLIHPRAVLTAAHCVRGRPARTLKIRAGEWDTQTTDEVLRHQDRNVATVVVHEKFHAGSLQNDYAILILAEAVELADNVDIICLPEQDMQFDYARCFASGWGKDVFGKEGRYQVILKKIDLPVVDFQTCQNSLRQTRLGYGFNLHKSFICAGGEAGRDTCNGDGGSPLVCPMQNDPLRYYQAGMVAWGIGCGTINVPGVYANVAKARHWIDSQMNANNLDNSYYNHNNNNPY